MSLEENRENENTILELLNAEIRIDILANGSLTEIDGVLTEDSEKTVNTVDQFMMNHKKK